MEGDASKEGSLKMFDNIVINRVGELDILHQIAD